MKHLFLFLFAITLTATSFSQLQVKESPKPKTVIGNYKAGGTTHYELSYKLDEDKDTVYTLLFKNAAYRYAVDYEAITFNSDGNTLNELYKVLKSVFSPDNIKDKNYRVSFTLGETEVIVSNYRLMGITSAMFYTDRGHTFIGEKQLDKLFGK